MAHHDRRPHPRHGDGRQRGAARAAHRLHRRARRPPSLRRRRARLPRGGDQPPRAEPPLHPVAPAGAHPDGPVGHPRLQPQPRLPGAPKAGRELAGPATRRPRRPTSPARSRPSAPTGGAPRPRQRSGHRPLRGHPGHAGPTLCARSHRRRPQRLPHRRVRDPPPGHGHLAPAATRTSRERPRRVGVPAGRVVPWSSG
jgi:hypothetical protein